MVNVLIYVGLFLLIAVLEFLAFYLPVYFHEMRRKKANKATD